MKLNLICGKDDLRPVMKNVLVTRENCVATNSFIVGVVPTTEIFNAEFIAKIPELGVQIYSTDWAKFVGASGIVWESEKIIKVYYPNGKKRPALIEIESEAGKYPNWAAVFPSEGSEAKTDFIGLNAELLATLQKSLNLIAVKLTFYDVNRAIKVSAATGSNDPEGSRAYGLIMPVMCD